MIETKTSTIDATDLQILKCLQENSRLTTKELAAKVHLSTTPVFERQKRLEREGYITKYVAVLDPDKLNLGFVVFCSVKLRVMNKHNASSFEEIISGVPQVAECYNISGDFDYLLKVYTPDMSTYKDFILNTLGSIEPVGSIQSTFVMNHVKQSYGLSL